MRIETVSNKIQTIKTFESKYFLIYAEIAPCP